MTDIQIMNLSNGAFISLKEVSIASLNLTQQLNWDSVDVIGRMNGIKNYKNTTRKRSFEIKTSDSSRTFIYTPIGEEKSLEILTKTFKNRTERIKMLNNPPGNTFFSESLNNFVSNGQDIQRFFYPSYIQEANEDGRENYFMQSAPMFYFRMNNQNVDFTSYCIINSFNFDTNDFGQVKAMNTFNLKFEIEEIASDITQVSSIVRVKSTGSNGGG